MLLRTPAAGVSAAAAVIAAAPGTALLATATMALGAGLAGFCRGELMGVARRVCCPATLGGDLALAVAVHGCEAAARAGTALVVATLVLALVLVALIAVCHFDLL